MKVKSGYMINQLGDQYVVVAVGQRSKEFQGMIKMNGSASFLWNLLLSSIEEMELIALFQSEYDLDDEQARHDVESFLSVLRQYNILDDEHSD